MPARVARSAGLDVHVAPYSSLRPASVAWQTSAFRELITTSAPLARKPAAIISPIPREPPVTTAVFPSTENRSLSFIVMGRDLTPGGSARNGGREGAVVVPGPVG